MASLPTRSHAHPSQSSTFQKLLTVATPTEVELLVAFFDLTHYSRWSRSAGDRTSFVTMVELFEGLGDVVEGAGGHVVKTIGDAALIVFPAAAADAGVGALVELQAWADAWAERRGMPCRAVLKVDVGPCVAGPVGPRSWKRFDVYGQTVNRAAVLESHGLALTPEAFRALGPAARRLFKKHTPPVRYIPVAEPHRDA